MKRVFFALIILTLVLSFCFENICALAETNEEILFRGIAWETPMNEAVEIIKDDLGDKISKVEGPLDYSYVYNKLYNELGVNHFKCHRMDFNAVDFEIATYNVTGFCICSIPTTDGQEVKDSFEDSIFACGQYFLNINRESIEEAVTDLKKKLTALYGGIDDAYEMEENNRYWEWHGANNTSVRLSDCFGSVMIVYEMANLDERLRELDSIYCRTAEYNEAEVEGL